MHGAVHDYINIKTVKDGDTYPSGETMHGGPVNSFVKYPYDVLTEQPIFRKILDIGSLDICGSQREYDYIDRGPKWTSLVGCEKYIGLDLIEGRSVDVIANSHDMPFDADSFDLVLCLNMLEHDSDPLGTIKEAYRVLKPSGVFILCTVDETWEEHPQLGGGDIETYNKITEKVFNSWLKEAGFAKREITHWVGNLMAYCIK